MNRLSEINKKLDSFLKEEKSKLGSSNALEDAAQNVRDSINELERLFWQTDIGKHFKKTNPDDYKTLYGIMNKLHSIDNDIAELL